MQWGLGKGTNLTPPACPSGYCESNLQRPCGHFFTMLFSLGIPRHPCTCWRQSLTWSFPHGIQLYWQFMASDWLKWPVTQVCHDWLIGIFVNLLDKVQLSASLAWTHSCSQLSQLFVSVSAVHPDMTYKIDWVLKKPCFCCCYSDGYHSNGTQIATTTSITREIIQTSWSETRSHQTKVLLVFCLSIWLSLAVFDLLCMLWKNCLKIEICLLVASNNEKTRAFLKFGLYLPLEELV